MTLPIRASTRLILAAAIAATFILFATSCAALDRLQEVWGGDNVPEELSTLSQVYELLGDEYGGKEEVVAGSLSAGAIQGMVDALEEDGATYLSSDDYDLTAPGLDAVWQAWEVLSARLEGADLSVTSDQLQEAAIRGMIEALGNPYTWYMDPTRYATEVDSFTADFEGIGAFVVMRDGLLTVEALIPDTPAERAGIQPGDAILESDGASLAGMSVGEAVLMIRGPRGTPVDLLIRSLGDSEPRILTVVRDTVQEPSVDWRPITEDLAHVWITQFLDNTDERTREVLEEILSQGFEGLILDVRGNLGGLLSSTVGVASEFLDDGLVLYQIDGTGHRREFPVRSGGVATEIRVVVLADAHSASGSEVLIGAFQDHERAPVIGTRTFGKGSVNELKKLQDGSGLYLTSALWHTPEGRLIEGEGLEPDILVFNEQLLRSDNTRIFIDRQLEAAIGLLAEPLGTNDGPDSN